ncbi:hypothetical protein B0H17DRAFT_1035536 [Mycena rosella]|uniref:Zn(2)-C6 fungal-type domain-containing protein n=1 Tax=Mycena rosella TaxID=1033263 RepID=A0AAD7GV84_MYCRO|nr:hypothetical protein B0H17DRAFT_1035536 [Mycena rosella]
MPKAPSTSNSAAEGPHPLKRNQACHQCRRRKLKCDAKRPACSTCIRSHAHAVTHAAPGTQAQLPLEPECTFDDVVDIPIVPEVSKSRHEKLESRIHELEALLLEKNMQSSNSAPPFIHQPESQFLDKDMDILTATLSQSRSPPLEAFISSAGVTSSPGSSPSSSSGLEMIWPNYPPGLPKPDLLRHLIEVFFVFHPHANRVLHYPSFMASLALSPGHPKFPATPVLHAICALGSLYTAAVSSPPLPNFAEVDPDEIFSERHRLREGRPDSFAEQQAKYARDTADRWESIGERLFEVLQGKVREGVYVHYLTQFTGRIILGWFYWSHSKWLELFTSSSHILRVSVPLGLNVCPPFHSITHSVRPSAIISPANTVIEDETRRNVFWLGYCLERLHGAANGWSLSMDDQNISQLLPVRGDQFEQGVLVTPPNRQWAHTRDLLLTHPDNQTDSFVLYIKGTMLISQVKTFNLRFRARHFFGDAAVVSPHSERLNPLDPIDPRGSPAFLELDSIASSFRSSFPSHLRSPIVVNVVDQNLYISCLMPLAATILLHDPHANVRKAGCVSALHILTAARSVLDLAYDVCNTSFDVTLLGPFCSVCIMNQSSTLSDTRFFQYCWFIAGRVLVRFLQAATDVNATDQISTLRAELEFFETAIMRIGQRIPLAFRYAKMLNDLVHNRCGKAVGDTIELSFPRNLEYNIETYFQDPNNTSTLHESLGLQGTAGSFMAVS